jgi:uncharacterized protein (UPF0332 family)
MAVAVAIDPRRVVEHAGELARHQSGAGRPRPIWLRRAVSAAYYAVFHAFALRVARQVLPQGSSGDQQRLTRSLEHTALREVCQWVIGNPGAGKQHIQPIVASLQGDPSVKQLASITFRLQEARHLADYDHFAAFDKASALSSVNEAEVVLNTLDALSGHANLEQLLALIALHSKLR